MKKGFRDSETCLNLMRAFAGESQARNRYTFAADMAKKEKLAGVSAVFLYTADQERAHAKVFFDLLKQCDGDKIEITGSYPVGPYNDIEKLLRAAQEAEYEEHGEVYPAFAAVAKEEGYLAVADAFRQIAEIEKTHGDRFGHLADLIEKERLFVAGGKTGWVCLNCGNIIEAKKAPPACPVCHHGQGYFVRLDFAPWVPGNE
ncbi:MAG: rubrerythrin family protein [Clostridia bacterium]|nr:rubrerythrin family protein [Clostridia bacterium]